MIFNKMLSLRNANEFTKCRLQLVKFFFLIFGPLDFPQRQLSAKFFNDIF